ncbi:fasciclin domain-containing protein [Sciscionella sediminilitoris]|uniref:fasciclin domain-containing protein n=1 Tax=Sciscionella sediminilitoris TaxID=1445613 RepID=UPI0004DFB8C6|nr:fasciclin domain-containing protein [Sciscionella sp. SE31]
MRATKAGVLLIAGLAMTSLAACGGQAGESGQGGASSQSSMSKPEPMPSSSSAAAMTGQFGPACAAVPKEGAGSFSGMAEAPVATAASNNPVLSTLVTAVKKAGLVDTLNNAKGITVFAPDNEAFKKVPKQQLDQLLADKDKLAKVLQYHVVGQQITPQQLAKGEFKSLSGQSVRTSGSGENFTVNDAAKVACGNVKTANATVYIVDSVLMPPM